MEKATAQADGVDGVGTDGNTSESITDPVAEWKEAVASLEKQYDGNRAKAVSAAAKKNPELHASYIEAVNSK